LTYIKLFQDGRNGLEEAAFRTNANQTSLMHIRRLLFTNFLFSVTERWCMKKDYRTNREFMLKSSQ